ncbi:uncharacterized protein VTP21DRAFT_7461 [Calcarisporiella thermophila]|uniref:uncharacterized protein n=1 Tax=Calcarisporiella thermophila TaxID=911321 RepID=UPI00374217EA
MQMFNPLHHRIDLRQAPLIRFITAQESDGRWILVRLQHHLIGDHSTMETFNIEIQAFLEGHGNTLPPPLPYRNLIAQARLGVSQDEHERFFKEMLADIESPTLPYGLTNVHGDGAEVTEARRMLPQELNKLLRSQAKKLGISLASLCHLAWALVIARTSGQQRVVFGTVLFGRMQAGASSNRAMGLFINTLPIRVDLDERSVEDGVRATHTLLAALLEHEHAPLALAQRCSGVPAGTPLFSSLLNYRHNVMPSSDTSALARMKFLDSLEHTNYPLDLSVEDFGNSLGLTVEALQPIQPDRVCGYMQQALESLVSALEYTPNSSVADLEVLPTEEHTLLLQTWNTTQEDYPSDLCLHHLFEQQVACTPEAIAVVYKDQSLTYAELNTRANRLAHHLIDLGVQPDDLVAICVERSPEMIIGLLAILKAGGAYVPLDPSYASDRLREILDGAAPTILVADKTGRNVLEQAALSRLVVVSPNALEQNLVSNPQLVRLNSRHLAYVIYTSGSTGKPKGVMIEHQGAVNMVCNEVSSFNITPVSRLMQFTSLSFDNSVSEIFSALKSGARLYLLQDDIRLDKYRLWDFITGHSITYISLTPSLLQDCKDMPPLETLRTVIVMGEAMPSTLPQALKVIAPNSMIINAYGPTETTVGALDWKYSTDFSGDIVPIGRPIANKRVYLLDSHGNPVPLGAVGELYIGGVGVARGYLNRPELTAERFLPDPFAGDAEARMYKTGDLARYLPDGNLVYLGRNDQQVKIRGFRIELGEIEARLHEHPLVAEAVVVAIGEEANKRLVAYVTVKSNLQPATEEADDVAKALRSYLATRLPDYMVPTAFVRMDALPLNSNGKLDRCALPMPGENAFVRQAYEPPQGTIESAISNIWADILNIARVGRHDEFFMIGGHSLLAMRMVSRIRHILGFEISLRTVFEAPTIAKLAPRLGESGTTQEESFHVLLPIKPQGSRAPLFCVHPVLGLSWCFIGLSMHLPPDQPLYGLQARGFFEDVTIASTLDEMVFDYIAQIRRVQPHGPYHLLGYSFGGLVAHTMAAHLEKQGERVALVALMDTPADYHTHMYGPAGKDQEEFNPTKILRGNHGDIIPDLAKPFFERTPKIVENNGRLAQSQAPLVFNGDLLIFRATVQTEDIDERLITPNEWKPYVLGKIETYDIHCGHEDMIKPEPLAEIGRILAQKLDESYSYGDKKEF